MHRKKSLLAVKIVKLPSDDFSARPCHHVTITYRQLPLSRWITISRTALQAFNERRALRCS